MRASLLFTHSPEKTHLLLTHRAHYSRWFARTYLCAAAIHAPCVGISFCKHATLPEGELMSAARRYCDLAACAFSAILASRFWIMSTRLRISGELLTAFSTPAKKSAFSIFCRNSFRKGLNLA